MLRTEKEEDNEEVLVVTLGQEVESQEEVDVCDAEDEEEQGSTPLMAACRTGMTEVSCLCVCEKEKGVYCCVITVKLQLPGC